MTPLAVIQRAARLAPELDRVLQARWDAEQCVYDPPTIEDVLRALYAAGLTLEADVGAPSIVKEAMIRQGIDPRR